VDLDPRRLRVMVLTSGAFSADPSGDPAARGHEEIAEAAIEGGATAVQLRAPELDDADLLPIALRVAARCRRARVLLVVNDRLEVARACGADGVHVGQDARASSVRGRLSPGRVLGMSVGDAPEAGAAEAGGADYLGVTVWPTPTKPEASARGLDGLRAVVGAVSIPVVGIGGIDAGNAAEVIEAGAAGVAVISAVAAARDPAEAVRDLLAAVDAARPVPGRPREARRA
jgi:thiamine-phosphate pyrophosphorylase